MRVCAGAMTIAAAAMLQGCAAMVLPLAAAGAIVKTRVDAGKRVRTAEAEMDRARDVGGPFVAVEASKTVAQDTRAGQTAFTPVAAVEAPPGAMVAPLIVQDGAISDFVHYAKIQADRHQVGDTVQSSVLVKDVSLLEPRTIECGEKPMAVIIDLDFGADGAVPPPQSLPTAAMLDELRQSGIGIVWISDREEAALGPGLATLRAGQAPIVNGEDILLFADGRTRKQERRWAIAAKRCVVATLGDRDGDFDELYDHLRDPGYAIRLERYRDKGWFAMPAASAAPARTNTP